MKSSSNYKLIIKVNHFLVSLFKNKMSLIYFLRAIKIFLKSILVYFKHGYNKSLPIGQVMRHVRVHLIMSYWRFTQFISGR